MGKIKRPLEKKSESLRKKVVVKSGRKTIKEVDDAALLSKIGRESAAQAIRESKALGLTITYMENGILYEEDAKGKKSIIKKFPTKEKTSVHLKKGKTIRVNN
ncbi:MAG: hypothetical protein H0V01_07635 [Bacteroidetes bacterium]|nr:hypothetical protein [Bacteroidota bacterium]HET6243114.1 hypothetical protein [Bacteroidia bacterium]